MSASIDWKELARVLFDYSKVLSTTSTSSDYNISSSESSLCDESKYDENPLLRLPFNVRESIMYEYVEPGMTSIFEQYIKVNLLNNKNYLQKLMNDLFKYSSRIQSHILAYNTIVVLSQLPYDYLGSWADIMAVAATRSIYLDVAEIGIRCFENWENNGAIEYLKGCRFEESWLQDYANEVCSYLEGVKSQSNVLST